jgi:hypothetical protein
MANAMEFLGAELLGKNTPEVLSAKFEPAVVTDVTTYTAADGNPVCVVRWRGATIRAAYLSTYTPAVDDVVVLLIQGATRFILGTLAGVNFQDPDAAQRTGSTSGEGTRVKVISSRSL